MITKKILSKIEKKAKKAGWTAGETSITKLSDKNLSMLCGLNVIDDERGFRTRFVDALKLKKN